MAARKRNWITRLVGASILLCFIAATAEMARRDQARQDRIARALDDRRRIEEQLQASDRDYLHCLEQSLTEGESHDERVETCKQARQRQLLRIVEQLLQNESRGGN